MKNKGFTLIELVTVIVLLGILAAVAVPRFVNVQKEARDAQREQLRAQIASGINLYVAEKIVEGKADPIPAAGDFTLTDILNEVPDGLTYETTTGVFTWDDGQNTYEMTYNANTLASEQTWSLTTWGL